jgi:hypothetical protein
LALILKLRDAFLYLDPETGRALIFFLELPSLAADLSASGIYHRRR